MREVVLVSVLELHRLLRVLSVRALELPHAAVEHAGHLLDLGLDELAVAVLVPPYSPVASVLKQWQQEHVKLTEFQKARLLSLQPWPTQTRIYTVKQAPHMHLKSKMENSTSLPASAFNVSAACAQLTNMSTFFT